MDKATTSIGSCYNASGRYSDGVSQHQAQQRLRRGVTSTMGMSAGWGDFAVWAGPGRFQLERWKQMASGPSQVHSWSRLFKLGWAQHCFNGLSNFQMDFQIGSKDSNWKMLK
jgi:hypothetical protein